MNYVADYLPIILFAVATCAIGGTFLYRLVKHGGLKGAAFGSKILATVGEVHGSGPTPVKSSVRVYELDHGDEDRVVGVEVHAKSLASYQVLPVALSREGAREFAQLVMSTADDTEETVPVRNDLTNDIH